MKPLYRALRLALAAVAGGPAFWAALWVGYPRGLMAFAALLWLGAVLFVALLIAIEAAFAPAPPLTLTTPAPRTRQPQDE